MCLLQILKQFFAGVEVPQNRWRTDDGRNGVRDWEALIARVPAMAAAGPTIAVIFFPCVAALVR